MKIGTYKLIKQLLIDYKSMDDYIESHIKSLSYQTGNKQGIAVTIADDLMITNLRKIKQTLEIILSELDRAAKEVIELYYMNEITAGSWEEVSDKTNYTIKQCKNINDDVIKRIAKRMGLPL